jgi:hypothetical protein
LQYFCGRKLAALQKRTHPIEDELNNSARVFGDKKKK